MTTQTEICAVCEQSPAYIRAIAPYQPGKPISELSRELGLDAATITKLASNENPLGIAPAARAAVERELGGLSRYPDGNAFDLKAAISRHQGVSPDCIVVGNGSNDVLEMLASAFLAAGTSAVMSQYCFAVYPLAAMARGSALIVTAARDYGHDLEGMADAVTGSTRVIFIANPNNPTGSFARGPEILRLLQTVPKNVVVVLDEAYYEYLPPESRYASTEWLARHDNLVIVRTFSKIYGMAGLRVGFGMMHLGIADLLNRVRQPFNVNNLALAAAGAALEDQQFVNLSYENNLAGMSQLAQGLRRLGLDFIPSMGNFLTVQIPRLDGRPQAARLFDQLLRRGVIVRPLAGYDMPDHLRVSIGLPAENDAFLRALGHILTP